MAVSPKSYKGLFHLWVICVSFILFSVRMACVKAGKGDTLENVNWFFVSWMMTF